ncbi:MAG: hypothetical protein ACM3S1_01365 [Hyphomicrobiales bacterium]
MTTAQTFSLTNRSNSSLLMIPYLSLALGEPYRFAAWGERRGNRLP